MRFSSASVLATSLSVANAGVFPRNFFTIPRGDEATTAEEAHKMVETGAVMTETVYHTITVGGDGAHPDLNMTAHQTVTVEAPATHCPEPVAMDPKKFEGYAISDSRGMDTGKANSRIVLKCPSSLRLSRTQ